MGAGLLRIWFVIVMAVAASQAQAAEQICRPAQSTYCTSNGQCKRGELNFVLKMDLEDSSLVNICDPKDINECEFYQFEIFKDKYYTNLSQGPMGMMIKLNNDGSFVGTSIVIDQVRISSGRCMKSR